MALFYFLNKGVRMAEALHLEKRNQWEEKIHQQQASGLSIQRWCHEHQIKTHVFYYRKDRLNQKTTLSRSGFTELVNTKAPGISIEYQGVRIHIDKNFDSATLHDCLSVLRGVKC
jgi:hypothetical protein